VFAISFFTCAAFSFSQTNDCAIVDYGEMRDVLLDVRTLSAWTLGVVIAWAVVDFIMRAFK